MSAENLKGCCPHTHIVPFVGKGVVDHSTKIPGGGSRDPIPLESVSADKTHLKQGVSGSAVPIPPKVGPAQPNVTLLGLTQFCQHFKCSRMQLHRWRKLVPFPKEFTRSWRYLRLKYQASQKDLDLWFVKVRRNLDKYWSIHTDNVRYH